MRDDPDRSKRSIVDVIERHARMKPAGAAVIHDDILLTYGDLDLRSRRVAQGLLASGCAAQDRIAFLGKNDPRYFEIFLGAVRAGVVLTPLNWRLSERELAYILGDAEARVLFVSAEYAPLAERLQAVLPLATKNIILHPPQAEAPCTSGYDAWRDAQDPSLPAPPVEPAAEALQIYTSGTTGNPKGALLTNANLTAYLDIIAAGPIGPFGSPSLILTALPLFHVSGACWGLNALYAGETNLLLSEASPDHLADAFARFPVTKAGMVPAVMQLLLDHPAIGQCDFSHLETIIYGAAPIAPDLLARAQERFGCRFVQVFGMTESASVATFLPPEDHGPERLAKMTSVGRAAPGIELRIVDARGEPLPAGEAGEVLLSGPVIMKGYWRQPDATAAALAGGWYHTGDVGYLDGDGYLFLCDRIKDMIISGGENIYSAEVEQVLALHPSVSEVAVIGVPDARWGETVKAIVVRADDRADAAALIAHARDHLASYKCPTTIDFVKELPRNATGKILKQTLRAPYWAGRSRAIA